MKRKRANRYRRKRCGLLLAVAIVITAVICILTSRHNKEQTTDISTIDTTYFSPETGTRGEGFSVCLDAGHGGSDPGALGGDTTEAEDTLAMTLLIGQCLTAQGCEVLYTRTDDTYLTLEERVNMANAAGVNALVSIHRNTVDDASVSGAEIWINSAAPSNAMILGTDILAALEPTNTLDTSRGVRTGVSGNASDNYWINRASTMASCIAELGFMSNDYDNQTFHRDAQKIAQAVANGILDALNDPAFY